MSEFDRRLLGELADCRMGETILSKDLDKTGYPIFSADSSAGPWGHKKHISKILMRGSIIIGARGTIGNPRLPNHDEFGCTQTTIAVTPSSEVDPYYLKLALESSDIKQISAQQAVPMLTIGQISQLEIPIPPLPEQKKIAEILSGIDKRIKLARQRVSQLEALIKSLGQTYFGTANQYDMKSIGELFEISSGTTPSRARQDYFCRKDGTPWVKTMDLNDNHIRTTDECLTDSGVQEGKARIFPKGTLLVAMYGGWSQIGRTGILAQNSSCNQAMSALLPTKEVLPEFLNLQLIIRRSYWKGVAASSRKDPNITKSDVAEMPILIPPIEDQLEIAKTLGSVMNSCQKEDRYLDSLNLLKQSVASDLLSGRKRVSI
jgi:type I restriction enzyme S subunit